MGDLHFLNARLSALRPRRLAPGAIRRLLETADPAAAAALLADTPYGRHIDLARSGGADPAPLEEALRRTLSEDFRHLLRIAAGECGEAVRIVLGLWEARVLKTVLRGKSARLATNEILGAVLPTGLHDEAALREMCRQPDLRGVVDLLATWGDPWARPLMSALGEYREPKDLFLLETALDRFAFADAARRAPEASRAAEADGDDDALPAFLSLTADRINLLTALTAAGESLPPADAARYFLPGGRLLAREEFDRVFAAASPADAWTLATATGMRRALSGTAAPMGAAPPPAAVERALDRFVLAAVRARARTDPLGLAPLVGYVLDRTREAANIRTIVRGRWAGLPQDEIEGLLILDA